MSYMKKEKSKYWNSEIELNKFIDMAERYSIDAILKSITNNRPYGIFTNDIENANENFNSFRLELSEKINKTNNPKAIELDLKDRFYPMLNAYIKFYTDNIERFDSLNKYNPYKIMFDIVNRTKNEIVKYFHISDIEKKELDNELLPNGIFYYEVNHSAFDSILKRLDSQFETINDYKDTLNNAIQRNGLIFRQSLNGLNRVEVMDAIKVQYSYYKETCSNMSHWLNATKDLIIQGFDIEKKLSKEIQSDFNTWYNNEISINDLSKPQQSNGKYDKTTVENFTTKIWFKVGLLFANGEMDKLLKKHDNVYTQIAKELNNISYRPYISDSMGTNTKSDKNIFNNENHIITIHDYCIQNKIVMNKNFLDKYNAIKT